MILDSTAEIKIETVAGVSHDDQVWISTALSIDHKPDRPDEHERIMESNGRVDPF